MTQARQTDVEGETREPGSRYADDVDESRKEREEKLELMTEGRTGPHWLFARVIIVSFIR